MTIELKVKSKTLAQESRYIRKEEVKRRNYIRYCKRTKSNKGSVVSAMERHQLYIHRVGVVRPEARATHLARAFIKGQAYGDVEQPKQPLQMKQMQRIAGMATLYSEFTVSANTVADWAGVELKVA